jgi:hypothetical protein
MRTILAGAAMLLGSALALPVAAQSVDEEIQNEEDPGSEIDMDIGRGGNVTIGRERNMQAPQGVQVNPGAAPQLLDDPDAPTSDDPVDAEEPGEGPEDLGGPTGETDEPD